MKTKYDTIEGHRIEVWDNGGKTADRYSIAIDDSVYGMSDDALAPNGFNMYSGEKSELSGWRQGKRIKFSRLPTDVKTAVRRRFNG